MFNLAEKLAKRESNIGGADNPDDHILKVSTDGQCVGTIESGSGLSPRKEGLSSGNLEETSYEIRDSRCNVEA